MTSDGSGLEERIKLLKLQLQQKKEEMKRFQTEQKRKKKEVLRQQEEQLKRKLEVSGCFITVVLYQLFYYGYDGCSGLSSISD
jgi:lipid II:glycine glycyltransferase (peptidoglycan interpeptide bridge formation enzyme)